MHIVIMINKWLLGVLVHSRTSWVSSIEHASCNFVISAFSCACVAARLVHAPRSSTGDVVVSETVRLNAAGSAPDDLGVAMANASDLYDKSAASANSVGTPAPWPP